MRTNKQNQTSTDNGRKSKGPSTPEGKANSAKNSVRHNLCNGHLVLLSNDDPREFHQHMNDYLIRFQPIDGVELDLVQKLIAASWREKRITAMESSLFELEMARQQPDVDDEYSELSPAGRQTLAFFKTPDAQTTAALLCRYGATARRAFASAFRILRELQGDRFNQPPSAEPLLQNSFLQRPLAAAANTPAIPEPGPDPLLFTTTVVTVVRRPSDPRTRSQIEELQNEPEHALAVGGRERHQRN